MRGERQVLKGLVGYCELCLLVQLYVELVRGSQVDRWYRLVFFMCPLNDRENNCLYSFRIALGITNNLEMV